MFSLRRIIVSSGVAGADQSGDPTSLGLVNSPDQVEKLKTENLKLTQLQHSKTVRLLFFILIFR
jgi:hypothetical protein